MRQIGKRLLSLTLAVLLLVALLPAQAIAAEPERAAGRNASGTFSDVPESAWFHDAVEYVYSHDLFQGTSAAEFSPYGTMTRAMMATVLGRLAQADPADYAGTSAFTDVTPGSWYAPYVAWAAAAGIADGVGQGRFAPDDPITRAQMATFLWRYFQHIGAHLPETVTDGLPGDYSAIPVYAREAAAALWRCGIFQGDGDNNFAPDRQLTRAEAAMLCMRVDTHLTSTGAKEETGKTGNASSGGGGSSDPSDPGGSASGLYYTPDAAENQTTATAQDVGPGFSITVKSSDSSLTADLVADLVIATDLSAIGENGSALTGCIQVSGSGGTYIITGRHIDYTSFDATGTPQWTGEFAPGHTYKIVLNDDRLTFDGHPASVREYDFTVVRQEELNLKLADGIVFIPAGEISNIIVNGEQVDSLDLALVAVGENGMQQNAGKDTSGSFAYSGQTIPAGSIVAVYEGKHPDARDTNDDPENTGIISYVKILSSEGSTYTFEGAEMEEVVATPDMFPLPSSYLDTARDHTITVPVSAFVFSGDFYTDMGLDSSAAVDTGDYIAFYSGYLDPASDQGGNFSAEAMQQYVQITDVISNGGTYTITYEEVALPEILDSMNTYVESDVDVGAMMTEQDISDLEDSLEAEAEESGFARAAAEEIARLALQTSSLEQVRDPLGLSSLTGNAVGSGSIAAGSAGLPAASGGTGGNRVRIELGIPRASVSTTLEHFSGMDGLRVALNIPFTLVITQSGGWDLRLEFDPTFVQELRIGVSTSVDVIWDNWSYIIWWIDEFEVTANVDVYTFTDIDIDVDVISDDGQADTPEQIEELTNFADEIKSLLEGDGGDADTAAWRNGTRKCFRTTVSG